MTMDTEELYERSCHAMAEALGEPKFARENWKNSKGAKKLMDGVVASARLLYEERQLPQRKLERFWANGHIR